MNKIGNIVIAIIIGVCTVSAGIALSEKPEDKAVQMKAGAQAQIRRGVTILEPPGNSVHQVAVVVDVYPVTMACVVGPDNQCLLDEDREPVMLDAPVAAVMSEALFQAWLDGENVSLINNRFANVARQAQKIEIR
jgi:hypothetical protein